LDGHGLSKTPLGGQKSHKKASAFGKELAALAAAALGGFR
jgi:hypothetical protein